MYLGGDVSLPTKQRFAEELSWKFVEVDEKYNINWLQEKSDSIISIAYDLKGNCAGVRATVRKLIDQYLLF